MVFRNRMADHNVDVIYTHCISGSYGTELVKLRIWRCDPIHKYQKKNKKTLLNHNKTRLKKLKIS